MYIQYINLCFRTDEDKRSIRQWMAAKRKERSKKYKEEVKSLRETEKRPFQPPRDKKLKTTLRRSPHEKRYFTFAGN